MTKEQFKQLQKENRRQKLKELIQVPWQRHRFYVYIRIAKRIRKLLRCRLSDRTIWQLMGELGIHSTMYHRHSKKPRTTTDTSQKPNLMRCLADLSGVADMSSNGTKVSQQSPSVI